MPSSRIISLAAGLLLLAASASWTAPAPAELAPERLTLDRAIQTALEQNQGLKVKREAVQRARAQYSEARAAGRPRVSRACGADGSGTWHSAHHDCKTLSHPTA